MAMPVSFEGASSSYSDVGCVRHPTEGDTMSLPQVATRAEWLVARTELLANEKELTRHRDALNVERRNLPMVEVEKDYRLDRPERDG